MNIDKETGEIIAVHIRTPYNYDTNHVSNETGLRCGPKTRTQQQFKAETDINEIVRRFGVTKELPASGRIPLPTTADFVEATDYQTSMNTIVQARESFMQLPSNIRARFDNNPQKVLAFLEDENNKDEAIKLGLVNKPPVPPAEPTPPAPAPAA